MCLTTYLHFYSFSRHVIKFHMTAPFGYHLALYSQTSFSLTDEDGVLPLLSKVSNIE